MIKTHCIVNVGGKAYDCTDKWDSLESAFWYINEYVEDSLRNGFSVNRINEKSISLIGIIGEKRIDTLYVTIDNKRVNLERE